MKFPLVTETEPRMENHLHVPGDCPVCDSFRDAFMSMKEALIEVQRRSDPIWEDGANGISWRKAKRMTHDALSLVAKVDK